MTHFRVWAPAARRIELELGTGRVPMHADEQGWWSVDVNDAGPGTDYGFHVDGTGPLPDPRSPFQPAGVHGRSRVVDHDSFRWSDTHWNPPPLSAAVIYELHVGTFTPQGTFEAAIDRLDHLVTLGVTHVELMPVAEFPGARGWGYDGVALFAPHHQYGGPDGLKRLVDACHARGLAVLLDVVYNHLGPDGNYLGHFGPYFTDRYTTPWGDAVNLDGPGSDEVRRFFCDNARMWLRDYHIDGLRLDAVHAIVDTSAVHFLEQLAREVDALEGELGHHLVLICENDRNDPRPVWSRERGGYGLDAQWNEDFHHALHALFTGERRGYYIDFGSLQELGRTLRAGFALDGRYSRFRGRCHGRPYASDSGHRLVGYLQNHDQVGNRARGTRIGSLLRPERLRVAVAVTLTAPFIPLLFQGEEWGASTPFQYFTDHGDPRLADAVREGRKAEFAPFVDNPDDLPDPQARTTFERSQLCWPERNEEGPDRLLHWYQCLIALRRRLPGLTDARLNATTLDFNATEGWLVMERPGVAILCNLGPGSRRLRPREAEPGTVLLASPHEPERAGDAFLLVADSVVIVQTHPGRN